MKSKTAILLHSYGAKEPNWDYVVWGEAPDKPGRIPTAIAALFEEEADLLLLLGSLIFKDGKSTGRLMKELLDERFDKLKDFTILKSLENVSIGQIREKVGKVFKLVEDLEQNTMTTEELQVAKNFLEKQGGYYKLICVSSPDHVARIYREAFDVFKDTPIVANLEIRGSATLYGPKTEEDKEKYGIKDVLIFEIPLSRNFPDLFAKILKASKAAGTIKAVNEFLDKYK
ncbi:MAG: hypothetical protein WC470_01365 [Candidatus Paceibacterota bacterium]